MPKSFEILIIDDTPQNLKLLINILSNKNFQIRVFSSPEQSIKSIELKTPDLILLDINMPKITGFQFATFLKQSNLYKEIPIIFITASSATEDKVKAFELGGVDYITKPFQIEEVLARVNAQLSIKQSKDELENTLNQTLQGTVSLLTDILSLSKPEIFNKSLRLKNYTTIILESLKIKNRWVYEISALLSQIGYIGLPENIVKKLFLQYPLTNDEQKILDNNEEISSQMLHRIPKLELPSYILLRDIEKITVYNSLPEFEQNIIKQGIEILNFVNDYETYKSKKMNDVEIESTMKSLNYNSKIVDVFFNEIKKLNTSFIQKKLFIKDLKEEMTLLEDIVSDHGVKILGKDTLLTNNVLHLLELYSKTHVITQQVLVSIIN